VVSRLGFRLATAVRFGLVLFPVPARRTGLADFPHLALGKDSRFRLVSTLGQGWNDRQLPLPRRQGVRFEQTRVQSRTMFSRLWGGDALANCLWGLTRGAAHSSFCFFSKGWSKASLSVKTFQLTLFKTRLVLIAVVLALMGIAIGLHQLIR
jgi:hypothetical protein